MGGRMLRQHIHLCMKSVCKLYEVSEHVSQDVCHSCSNSRTVQLFNLEGYLKYVIASGKLIVTRLQDDHLLSTPRTVQREFFSKKQHTQVNHVSSCWANLPVS